MSCTNPRKAFILGTKLNGKKALKLCTKEIDHVEQVKDKLIPVTSSRIGIDSEKVFKEFIEVPCGQCLGCKLDYARQWADRCMLESTLHKSNYFITLTYDDNNIPYVENMDSDTGEYSKSQTLVKKDFQKFIKRLRKKLESENKQSIRYFACGEYGSTTKRPHYHAIIFGLELSDLVVYKKNNLGDILYNSQWLQELWPYGYVVVGNVTFESCSYVARYVTKKQGLQDKTIYDKLNISKEFTVMSRKPGIAKDYFYSHFVSYATFCGTDIPTENGRHHIGSIRYFDKLMDSIDPAQMLKIKENRAKIAIDLKESKLNQTSLDYKGYLKVEEDSLFNRTKSLSRKEI